MQKRTQTPDRYADENEPSVSEDGMTWIDGETGEPPDVDEQGRLKKSFVLVDRFRRERWGPGNRLPLTPAAWAAHLAAVTAAAEKKTSSDRGAGLGNTEESDDMAKQKTAKKKTAATKTPKVVKHAERVAAGNAKVAASASSNGKTEHPPTGYFEQAKKEGVRVARASRGGYKIIVVNTLNRALTGVWETPEAAKKTAEAAGLSVKGMPSK